MLQRTIFLTFAFCALLLTSCKDDCDAPLVDENIIGEWELQTGEDVEFQADGTLIDLEDGIIGFGDEETIKTWSISGNSLAISALDAGGAGGISTDFAIVENECDEITIGILGFNLKMERK